MVYELLCNRGGGTLDGSEGPPARSVRAILRGALGKCIPFILFSIFCFMPSVSRSAFRAFACQRFGYQYIDVQLNHGKSFLVADYSVQCSNPSDHLPDGPFPAHEHIKLLGYVFITIWPVCGTLFFAAILFAARRAITQQRPTTLSNACRFLYREYLPSFYWWEVLELLRKIILSGGLLVIPSGNSIVHLLIAIILTLGHLVILLSVQPYENHTNALTAAATDTILVVQFLTTIVFKFSDQVRLRCPIDDMHPQALPQVSRISQCPPTPHPSARVVSSRPTRGRCSKATRRRRLPTFSSSSTSSFCLSWPSPSSSRPASRRANPIY